MTNEQAFLRLMDKCDIYFENSLISKEWIIQKYAEFLASSLEKQTHTLSVVQHTGSVCFDVISFLIAALGCLALNETDNNEVIRSFEDGQMVMLASTTGKRKERIYWRGLFCKTRDKSSDFDNAYYACLEQPEQHAKDYLPRSQWYRISPYNGQSTRADGRGIRKSKSSRNEFISYLFNIPVASIPSVIGVSTVIVTDREVFRRIADGVRVEYGKGNSIGLLDLVTASYYTSNLEEHQYGANPSKTEPVLKITSRISAARDLVLDKSGNKTVGFMVVGTDTIASGDSELSELLDRKSLKFSMLSTAVDSDVAQEIIETQDEASIFVCTKDFLLQHSEASNVKNSMTAELNHEINNIINNEVSPVITGGMCSWQKIKVLKNSLFAIKRSDIKNEEKDAFIVTAHAMLNLILTALFPLGCINSAIEHDELLTKATAPSAKLNELWKLADKQTELIDQFITIADIIDGLYRSVLTVCPKHEALIDLLDRYRGQQIAIIVPKVYYIDIIKSDNAISGKYSTIVTANRFDRSVRYDVIIVAGDFSGTHFNPFKCRAASKIFVLLYDGEERLFSHKKQKAASYERSINVRLNVETDDGKSGGSVDSDDVYGVESVIEGDSDLNRYIDTITAFDAHSFVQKLSGCSGNTPSTEAYAVGHFPGGEQIIFTRYYQAVVFDEMRGTVSEKDVDSLLPGDVIVFAKRDDHTKNMVDYIYDQLLRQTGGQELIEATEKAQYWKLILREYKDNKGLSYRDIAKRLRSLGMSIQEVSVRQWLIEESHIVGPREENALEQIANLTRDPFLRENTHAYFEACEIVRKQRKKILRLIGKAIADKLSGLAPKNNSLLKNIFDNVENLSETMELDDVSVLDKPVSVPVTYTNRPINNREMTL